MSKKSKLLSKLCGRPAPRDFKVDELHSLMKQCGCVIIQGGRGSAIKFVHTVSKRVLIFDEPHPGNELYPWQIGAVKDFLISIGEIKNE